MLRRKTRDLKWERLSTPGRAGAGILAALSFICLGDMWWTYYQSGSAAHFERALASSVSAGIGGVIFLLAAVTGLSPDVIGLWRDNLERK